MYSFRIVHFELYQERLCSETIFPTFQIILGVWMNHFLSLTIFLTTLKLRLYDYTSATTRNIKIGFVASKILGPKLLTL